MNDLHLQQWLQSLEREHLSELTFQEVSRALRALSTRYVGQRDGLRRGAALHGAGKRAAFALFYGPLHFLLVRHIVERLPGAGRLNGTLLDLGCGTGASGAAWSTFCAKPPSVLGVDRNAWALEAARKTYRTFGVSSMCSRRGLSMSSILRSVSGRCRFFLLEDELEAACW
jgi:methylase of polypeptide subunit release factors